MSAVTEHLPAAADTFRLGAVIITMGNRPAELNALIESVRAQEGPTVELAVVANGAPLPPLPPGVRSVELPENLGIPGGRNVGIELFGKDGREVDAVLFLDDDGRLPGHRLGPAAARGLQRRPGAGDRQLPDRRPRHRRHPAPATSPGCAPATRCAPPG